MIPRHPKELSTEEIKKRRKKRVVPRAERWRLFLELSRAGWGSMSLAERSAFMTTQFPEWFPQLERATKMRVLAAISKRRAGKPSNMNLQAFGRMVGGCGHNDMQRSHVNLQVRRGSKCPKSYFAKTANNLSIRIPISTSS